MTTHLPIPHLTSNLRTAMKWYCDSNEYCTWDGKLHFSCCGHGDTMREAYMDWLEAYTQDRYYEEEDDNDTSNS